MFHAPSRIVGAGSVGCGWRASRAPTRPRNRARIEKVRRVMRGSLQAGGIAVLGQHAFDLGDVLFRDALGALKAPPQAVEDVLPHGPRRPQALRPVAAPLELELEGPDAGEQLGADIAPAAADRVDV